jgi:uridine phosphorylase
MLRRDYPILEFDPTREAVLEPCRLIKPVDVSERCVVCFFADVISKVVRERSPRLVYNCNSEIGSHPVYELEHEGRRVAFFHPGVGAPLAAGMLEEVAALGCRSFVACGGAGVLDREIAVGHLVVPTSAVRDEGTSYHYLPPGREVEATPEAVAAVRRVLDRRRVPYVEGKTWTTDAFYRETPEKVRRRREEGCLTVEMEAAGFFAVARFRGLRFAQILYGGDDVSSETWDSRDWQKSSVREKLFWLAVESCLEL